MAQFQTLPGYSFRPPSFTPLPVRSYFDSSNIPKTAVSDPSQAIAPIAQGISQAILNRPRYQAQQQAVTDAKKNAELQETLRSRIDDPAYQEMITVVPNGVQYDPSRPVQMQIQRDRRDAQLARDASNQQVQQMRLEIARQRLAQQGNRRAPINAWDMLAGTATADALPVPSTAGAMISGGSSIEPDSGLFNVGDDLPVPMTAEEEAIERALYQPAAIQSGAAGALPAFEPVSNTLEFELPYTEEEAMFMEPDFASAPELVVPDVPEIQAALAAQGGGGPSPIIPGNIDLANRPVVRNPDGKISTVRSIVVGTDKGQVVIPTVARDGSGILSDDDAFQQFRDTGEHLGVFADIPSAEAYASRLSGEQDQLYSDSPAHTQDRVTQSAASTQDQQAAPEKPKPFVIPSADEKREAVIAQINAREPAQITPSGRPIYKDAAGSEYISGGIQFDDNGNPVELRAYRNVTTDARGNPQWTRFPLLRKQTINANLQKEMTDRGIAWNEYTTPEEAMRAIVSTPKPIQTKPMSAEERRGLVTAVGTAQNLSNITKAYDDLYKQGKAGVKGWPQELLRKAGFADADFTRANTNLKATIFNVARALNGPGVLTDRDLNRIADILPSMTNEPEQFHGAFEAVKQIMAARIGSQYQMAKDTLDSDTQNMIEGILGSLSAGEAPVSADQIQSVVDGSIKRIEASNLDEGEKMARIADTMMDLNNAVANLQDKNSASSIVSQSGSSFESEVRAIRANTSLTRQQKIEEMEAVKKKYLGNQ